ALVRATSASASWRRAIVCALAPVPVYGPIALLAIVLGAEQLDWYAMEPWIDRIGALEIGVIVGAIVGVALGVWIGTSAALAALRAAPSRA
nr:hypothetical protein [Myxococcota bacterium]